MNNNNNIVNDLHLLEDKYKILFDEITFFFFFSIIATLNSGLINLEMLYGIKAEYRENFGTYNLTIHDNEFYQNEMSYEADIIFKETI